MTKIKTRIILFLFVITAFLGPFIAITTIEKAKRSDQLLAQEREAAAAQTEAAYARYQYYLEVSDRKTNLKQAMDESKAQYEQLIKDQPAMVKDKQTTVTQTVIKPVVTQKTVQQKTATASSKSSTSSNTSTPAPSKPKATTTTKTS